MNVLEEADVIEDIMSEYNNDMESMGECYFGKGYR